jgi:hypothetical protein
MDGKGTKVGSRRNGDIVPRTGGERVAVQCDSRWILATPIKAVDVEAILRAETPPLRHLEIGNRAMPTRSAIVTYD